MKIKRKGIVCGLVFLVAHYSASAAESAPVVLKASGLRVEVSAGDGVFSVTDLRNKRVWKQVLVEKDPESRQRRGASGRGS
jgi:hypothetical protein